MLSRLEGKIVNQPIQTGMSGKVMCGCCRRLLDPPKYETIVGYKVCLVLSTTLGRDEYIFETREGSAIMYCNYTCASKHNHRYNR